MIYLIVLFWMITSIYGNIFLKYNFGAGINPLYTLMGICIVIMCANLFLERKEIRQRHFSKAFKRMVLVYSIIYIIYVIYSFVGCVKMFHIYGFDYNKSFIFRQSYVLFTIPIAYVIIITVIKKDIFSSRNAVFFYFALLILWICAIIGKKDNIAYTSLIYFLSSYIYCRKKTMFSFLILIIAPFFVDIYHSTYFISYIAMLMVLGFKKRLARFLSRNLGIKVAIMLTLTLPAVVFGYGKLLEHVSDDPNAVWRLQYWTHEMGLLIKTKFFGVGFGTPYASTEIYKSINNINCFRVADDGLVNQKNVLFVTAQHSSLVNQFYRMGIVGGMAFIFLNVFAMQWFGKIYFKINDNKKETIITWAFANYINTLIIILINPGMESPKYYIGYLFTFAILIGQLCKYETELWKKSKCEEEQYDKQDSKLNFGDIYTNKENMR